MIPAITMFWSGLPKGVRDGLMLAGIIVLGLILGKAWVEAQKNEARQKERAKAAVRNAEEHARTIEASTQVKEELHERADEARDAVADLPVYPDADSLRNDRPDLARIVFGDRPGNGG